MTKNPLPCFVCGRELMLAAPDHGQNQPMHGTAFDTFGHYGSGVFDSIIGDERCELAICDSCFHERKDRTRTVKHYARH